jgi:UDP-N-acetylglucosamine--N-acetylmuramyl-(pentapeptide) pyrophosphoryl-undecaprenol N-acetylglucosamine transferase
LSSTKADGASHFGIDSTKKTLLIMGGSLGARSINEGIAASLPEYLENGIQLIWQTGSSYFPLAKELLANLSNQDTDYFKSVKVLDFITDMDKAYAASDAIVSRAGALAVSEICCVGKPVILVPSPYVAEDHQTKNALALCEKDAAILVKDSMTKERLAKIVLALFADVERMEELTKNVSGLAKKDATNQIVREAMQLMS